MKTQNLVVLALGTVLGGLTWALSPLATGHAEPWDAPPPFYPAALFVSGLLAVIPAPRQVWVATGGVILGQMLYMLLMLQAGPLVILGLFFIAACSLISTVGALLTFVVSHVIQNYRRR